MYGPKGFAGIFSKMLWHVVFEVSFKKLISNNCFFLHLGRGKGFLNFGTMLDWDGRWLRNWLFLSDILYAWFQRDLHAFSQKNMACGFEVPFENKIK